MRIALIVSGGVDRSGRERVIPALLWLVERLARRHALHVFALRHYLDPCTYPLLGATVHDLGRAAGAPGTRWLRQWRALRAGLRSSGPFDVLHGYWAMPAGVLAAAAGRWLHIPSVVTLDSGEFVALPDIDYGLPRRWRGRLAMKLIARAATRLTVCSEYMERLAAGHGLAVDRVPLGVDRRAFAPRRESPPGAPRRLLHVASLNRVKDQATLLRAFARVVDRLPDAHLDIVGEDTLGGAVQALCADLGLAAAVTFHGFQPTDRLRAFYERAHLLVLSSRHEAAGVVVLEAGACGVPAVGTAVGYIADGSPARAVAVPVGDADALADAILGLLADAARRERLGRAAQAWALAHDADWTAQQMERIYEELVSGSFSVQTQRRHVGFSLTSSVRRNKTASGAFRTASSPRPRRLPYGG